jgi:hypothetical protein
MKEKNNAIRKSIYFSLKFLTMLQNIVFTGHLSTPPDASVPGIWGCLAPTGHVPAIYPGFR